MIPGQCRGLPMTGAHPRRGPTAFGSTSPRALRRLLLAGDQLDDLADGVEMVDARLVSFNGDAEPLLDEDDELQCADRVEDAAGDERRLFGQIVRVFAGQELSEDVVLHGFLD